MPIEAFWDTGKWDDSLWDIPVSISDSITSGLTDAIDVEKYLLKYMGASRVVRHDAVAKYDFETIQEALDDLPA